MHFSRAAQILSACICCVGAVVCTAQVQPPIPPPDERFKTDILLIVAHPDDDTAASTYLSKAALDEGKRVSIIVTTRGNSGPNAVGMEQSKALSDVREQEARHSMAARGVQNVWFLNGQDVPTQDVLHSLEIIGHGAALEEVVRLVRLTRPEVILTWMPAYVAGENHGDHQASSVLATEAFDMAADPVVFPEQLEPPRAHRGISNYGEGLRPWQPKKLYFFSDTSHPEFLKDHGPVYLASEKSKARGKTFSELNREAWQLYATQLDFNDEVLRYFTDQPDRFVLARTLVPSSATADVWTGIPGSGAVVDPQRMSYQEAPPEPLISLGGPWSFYRALYRVHHLEVLQGLVPPESALGSDRQLWVPLNLHNSTAHAVDVHLASTLPSGWQQFTGPGDYHLEAGETYPVQVFLQAPPEAKGEASPQMLKWTATSKDGISMEQPLAAYLEFDGVTQ